MEELGQKSEEVNGIARQLFEYRDSALAIYGESYFSIISENSEKIIAVMSKNNIDAVPAAVLLASAANNGMEKLLLMAGLCEICAPLAIERDEEALSIRQIEAMFRCRDRVKSQLSTSDYAAKMKECGLAVVEEARRTELPVMVCGCTVAARQACDEAAVQVIAATVELLE
jgi:hypothetical protein